MKRFDVRRTIAAPAEQVWACLTDGPGLVAAGLGIHRLEGAVAPGARLKLWTVASPDRAFALRVTEFRPPRRMVWTGGMPLGLFTGVRTFTLIPVPGGSATDFHMSEEFSGLLAPLITRSIPDLTASFEMFADGLRALAERHRP